MFESARRLLAIMKRRIAADGRLHPYLPLLLEGRLALGEGRPDDAIRPLQRLLQQSADMGAWDPLVIRASVTLADAWTLKGDLPRAIAVLEAAPQDESTPGSYLQMREKLSQLYRRIGRTTDARLIEDDLNNILAVAQNDHPIKRRLEKAHSDEEVLSYGSASP
jgi:hypothetical protein